jgi:Myosin-binding striated muscle assembly central
MDTTDDIQSWEKLLQKSRDSNALLPEELSYLISGFLPVNPPATRSKAYLILSSFCQGVRRSSPVNRAVPDPTTETLVRCFGPLTVSRLSDTEESTLLAGVTFLTALFHVDWESASSIFQQDGVLEAIMDSVDLDPSVQLSLSVAQLLAQACGHKGCRSVLTSQSFQWLEYASRTSGDMRVRAGATNALIKLSKGSAADASESSGVGTQVQAGKSEDVSLAAAMEEIIISGSDIGSSVDAIEGLAYLSVNPAIKDSLSRDSKFLRQLFSLLPSRKVTSTITPTESTSTLVFGILVIIVNLCAYRPHLTEEQAQIEKLRRMAQAGNDPAKSSSVSSAFDDDEHVRARVRRLIDAGVLDIFSTAVRTDSSGVRVNVGKVLLSITEDKENRGIVLQRGGAKVLITVLKHATSTAPSDPSTQASALDAAYLDAVQALAKLTITSSPVQVFGPNEGVMYDVIRPFSSMLQHSSSTLLQRFESIMALTNLSSHSSEVASRIAQAEGLLAQIEFLLLEEHTLIRRAAMELLCNLIVGSDPVFEKYGGEHNPTSVKSKLQIVLALSDVDDLPTRLAAAGALATLTAAPGACQALVTLQLERRRVLPILAQLIDPIAAQSHDTSHVETAEGESHPGLVHRGIICVRNIILNISDEGLRKRLSKEAKETGLLQGLTNIMKGQVVDEAILRPTAETLKVLLNNQN